MEAVVPGLKFVEDENRVLLAEEILQERLGGNDRSRLLELAAVVRAFGMSLENHIPEGAVFPVRHGFGNGSKTSLQCQPVQTGRLKTLAPRSSPLFHRAGVQEGMMEQRHDVRLAPAPLTDEDNWTAGGGSRNSTKPRCTSAVG